MVIHKYVPAHIQLDNFAQDRWDEVGELVKYILDNNEEDAFDNLITMDYFPNGAEEDEFEKFCCENAEELIEKLK